VIVAVPIFPAAVSVAVPMLALYVNAALLTGGVQRRTFSNQNPATHVTGPSRNRLVKKPGNSADKEDMPSPEDAPSKTQAIYAAIELERPKIIT
jgi:hypothetical protein